MNGSRVAPRRPPSSTRARERFALVVEASNSGIWEQNHPNDDEWWSPRLYELLGYSANPSGSPPATLLDLVHSHDSDHARRAMEQHLEGLVPLDIDLRVRTARGAYRWFNARGAVLRDPDGTACRFTGTLTDIHERRMAVADLERFMKLSSDLVCTVDVDGTLRTVNPGFLEAVGYEEEELLDTPLFDFIHPDDLDATVAEFESAKANRSTRSIESRLRRKGGGWLWLSWSARSDSTGTVYAIGKDVTETRLAMDRLVTRASELERTNQELEQFVHIASHDLQEPLRTVVSYAGLVDDRYGEQLDDDGRRFLGFMSEAANHMRSLLQALLDYSRLGRCQVEPERSDIGEIVRGVLLELKGSVEEAGVRVDVADLPELPVDPQLFPLVVRNLVSNAIKFRGTDDPTVTISAERTPSGWRVDVVDNGIGIKDEYKERVFEVFKRLHGRSRYGGTGIGLAVCRRVIHRHGGRIWCTPLGDEGTAFHFTIPSGSVAP